ncbi:MAG TPA: Rrf2 family transcriptional regulator [Candidatus Dormibacteraeota bacterium]|nr:Rrf2 family transcriptional regulator [Candidatus Dormibacteraeota bacterium]
MRTDYGLRALIDLAGHYPGPAVPCHEIAAREHIPAPFLDQVLMALRRHGLVLSTRGPRGGHVLARPPATITLAQAIEILEGGSSQMGCFDTPDLCDLGAGCRLRSALRAADRAAADVLAGTTLAELVSAPRPRQPQLAVALAVGPAA